MDKLLEKIKIKMVMRLRGVSRKAALTLLGNTKIRVSDGKWTVNDRVIHDKSPFDAALEGPLNIFD